MRASRQACGAPLSGGGRGNLGVDLHRDGDLAVPQDAHGDTRMDVERGQQRGAGLSGAMDGDPGDTGSDDAAIEAPPEVARLDGRAVPGGEDQASINPAISRTVTVGVLLLLSDLQCGHAQIRQRQRGLGSLGLDLAADELVPDALELLSHVQLGCVEVDLIPGQAEYFAPAQAEDEDQDEGGIKRFTRIPGRFEEPAGIINSPRLMLTALSRFAAFGYLDGPEEIKLV